MNILLIYACYPPEADDAYGSRLPIGLGYLSTALLRENHRVLTVNLSFTGLTFLKDLFRRNHWDLAGFTMYTFNRDAVIDGTRLVKELSPETQTVVGGPHPTALPHLFPSCYPSIDFAVYGPGEKAIVDLAQSIAANDVTNHPRGISGSYQNSTSVLDHLGSPSLGLNNSGISDEDEFIYLSSSRGCTGHCTFCSSPSFFPGKPRHHSIDWIMNELDFRIHTIGCTFISFRDESFTDDDKKIQALAKAIIENKTMNFQWECQCKVREIDEETVRLMAKAGCTTIQLGVEHGSESIRKLLGKPCSDEEILKSTSIVKNAGIDASWYLITAIPGETKADRMKTRALARKAKPTDAIVSPLSLYPGTALFYQFARQKKLKDTYWLTEKAHWVFPLPEKEALAIARKESLALNS